MLAQSRIEECREIFKKLMGVIVLMSLFAIAELAPETNADDVNPLVGKWAGQSVSSSTEHTLRIEGDRSFTWDSSGKLLMSGTWTEEDDVLELKFGNEEHDVIHYQLRISGSSIQLRNDQTEYNLKKQKSE